MGSEEDYASNTAPRLRNPGSSVQQVQQQAANKPAPLSPPLRSKQLHGKHTLVTWI